MSAKDYKICPSLFNAYDKFPKKTTAFSGGSMSNSKGKQENPNLMTDVDEYGIFG